jgi:hypothetical protein
MTTTLSARFACAGAVAFFILAGSAARPIAATAPPPPDAAFDLPAGVACAGFDLRVEIWGSPHQVYREFFDKNGNLVRTLTAGKGNTLAFTNLLTGKQLWLQPNGSVTHVVLNLDGSQTVTITGHNVLILFPTDVPAGPSTTLYVGRIVFTVDPTGVFTLQRVSGTSTDICAALE